VVARAYQTVERWVRSRAIPDDEFVPLTWKTSEPEPEPEAEGPAVEEYLSRPDRLADRWLVAVAALLGVAFLAAVVFGVVEWRRADHNAAKASKEQAALKVAGNLGQAMLSYDSSHLDVSRQRVAALATANFVKTYEQDFTKSLGQLVSQLQAKSSATLKEVYLTQIGDGTAKAIVVVDFSVNSTAGTVSRPGTYLLMDLVRQRGQWKVDGVQALGFTGSQTATPPAPSGSTTTTTSIPR
jgi:Mce-associated membrane protein